MKRGHRKIERNGTNLATRVPGYHSTLLAYDSGRVYSGGGALARSVIRSATRANAKKQ